MLLYFEDVLHHGGCHMGGVDVDAHGGVEQLPDFAHYWDEEAQSEKGILEQLLVGLHLVKICLRQFVLATLK